MIQITKKPEQLCSGFFLFIGHADRVNRYGTVYSVAIDAFHAVIADLVRIKVAAVTFAAASTDPIIQQAWFLPFHHSSPPERCWIDYTTWLQKTQIGEQLFDFYIRMCYNHEEILKGGVCMQRPRGDNQQRILEYIKNEIQVKGYPPSVREIANAVGLKSTSTVHGHLQRLEKRGLLHRDAMKPRAMEVVGDPNFVRNSTQAVPLVGNVQAGLPILAEENLEEYVSLPDVMLSRGNHFILHVHGNSMINAGIYDGDFIVVKQQHEAKNGEIVVALLEDSATVKRFFREDGRIRLQPENDEMDPIYADDVSILGVVVSMFRLIK